MHLIQRLILILVFVSILTISIAYARGYRLDLEKKSVTPTGILAISSTPKAAKIYLNGVFKGATDTNLTLPPGNYQVEIKKEGFTSWSKTVNLKGELVLTLEAVLFPLNPSLSPLTNLGIIKAIPLDATEKILLFSQNNDSNKDGIYLYEAGRRPLTFFPPIKLIVLKKNLPEDIDFAKGKAIFSPDYEQVIIEFPSVNSSLLNNNFRPLTKMAYLFSLSQENQVPFDVTTSKEALIEAWEKEKEEQKLKILETFPKEIVKIATDSFHLISFSPNETKIFYQAKKNLTLPLIINPPLIATNQTKEGRSLRKDSLYVYDKKEDKNYEIKIPVSQPLTPNKIENLVLWLPDSKNLVFIEGKKIVVVDYDGINKRTVYSGPFENSFFTLAANGDLIILTNLNPENNQWPDLYAVGIK